MFDENAAKTIGKQTNLPQFEAETPEIEAKTPEKGVKLTENEGKSVETGPKPVQNRGFNWKSYPVDELIRIRDEITQALPPIKLSEMDLENEMLLQFHSVRQLQTDCLSDTTLPLNQRAQVSNSVSSVLTKLVELQSEVFSSERFKLIESILIRCLRTLPENVAVDFLTQYEDALIKAKFKPLERQ